MEQPQQEIRRYIKLIIKKRYLFVTLFLAIMSIIVWGSYFIPRKYEAKSIIFIESNVIEQLVAGIAITPSMDARIKVLRDTMLGRSLVLNVLRKLDLDTRVNNDKELEQMIVGFQNSTNIRVRSNSLITVSFISSDPILAKNYINTLVNEYLEKNIFAKREEAYNATKFLEKQVTFFKEKMDKGEDEIISFRQQQGIYIAMDEGSVVSEIKNHGEAIEEIKIRKNELIASNANMKKQLASEKPYTVAMFSTRDIEGTIESLEYRLRQLLIGYTENYPEVLKLKAEIDILRKQQMDPSSNSLGGNRESEVSMINPMHQELKQKLSEAESEINSLNAKENYLNKLIGNKEKELREIPESKKILSNLEKERDSFKSVYEKLLERLGQSEVSKQMEIADKATTFRVIEPAILPTIPISPNIKMLILAGIFLGFAGGFGTIYLFDNMDNSIKSVDTLKSLGLPILAIIPTIQDPDDLIKSRRRDILVFSIVGLYMICILGILTMEHLGLTYVGDFIRSVFV